MARRVKARATKPAYLSLISGTHVVEGESYLVTTMNMPMPIQLCITVKI